MTKCGIDNNINCQSRPVENCLWEEYEHLKEEQALASETERKVALLLCCSADWIYRLQQKLLQYMFAFWHLSMGQRTTLRHCPGCVTTRCCHEGPGSLTWMANGRDFTICMAWPSRHCASHTDYPTITQYI